MVKVYKLLVIILISSEELIYSIATIINNTVACFLGLVSL